MREFHSEDAMIQFVRSPGGGKVWTVVILHDDACSPSRCVCRPIYRVDRQTCYQLSKVVQEEPGLTLREALAKFKHHYATTASACANLPEWIEKGKVPGVRLDRADGKPRLFLIEQQPKEREHG